MQRPIRYELCVLSIFVLLLGAACDRDNPFTEVNSQDLSATVLTKGVAFFNRIFDKVQYLEPNQDGAEFKEIFRLDDEEVLIWMEAGPTPGDAQNQSLYLLTSPSDVRNVELTEQLHVVDPSGKTGASFDVGAPFDGVVFGPEGRYGILYFSREGLSPLDDEAVYEGVQSGFYNPNEIAILDLDAAPSESNPQIVSIDIDGGQVKDVVFLEALSIAGSDRRLVAFFADNLLKLVDLENPTLAQAQVPLTNQPGSVPMVPQEIVTLPGSANTPSMLFVRASGSNDIYGLSLIEEEGVDFTASLNLYEGGSNPVDIEVINDGEKNLLVAVNNNGYDGQFRIIDIDTSDSFTINVEHPVTGLLPRTTEDGEELVGYGRGGFEIYFLQVPGLSSELGANLQRLKLSFPVGETKILSQDKLIVRSSEENNIVVLDLGGRDATVLQAHVEESLEGAQLFGDLLYFARAGDLQINVVDLVSGHPDSVYLDDQLAGLFLPSGSNFGIALHDLHVGRVTVFENDAPSRATARVIDGLWLNDLFENQEVK